MIDTCLVCTQALEILAEQALACGVDLPERRYITPGNPSEAAWDCASVIVGVERVASGMSEVSNLGAGVTGPSAMAWTWPNVTVTLLIVRDCVPVLNEQGTPPDAADIDAAGRQTLQDLGLLVRTCTRLAQPDRLAANTRTVTVGGAETRGPDGGFAAAVAQFVVSGE